MKIKSAFFILSIFLISQTAFAGTPAHKLARGLEGVVTSPMEYLNQYQQGTNKHGVISGLAIGVIGGTAMLGKRLVNGVYDIVSFPVSAPKDYGLLLADDSETAIDAYSASQNSTSFPLGKGAI